MATDNTETHETLAASAHLWELTVLCLLREKPMHPYQMRHLIHERNKEDFLVLKRGSLYHAIGRLEKAGLITAIATTREGKRPERTVYQLTPEGEAQALTRLRTLLAFPVPEPSRFVAAVSFLAHLAPEEVIQYLEERVNRLDEQIREMDAALHEWVPRIGRLVVLETEYARAIRQAERDWIQALLTDLREGRLSWNVEAIFRCLRAISAES